MRYFFDTEFIEDGRTIDLISIGIVGADGREFYAESSEFDASNAGPWVRQNVLPHLFGNGLPREGIARAVAAFVGDKPEFWADYGSYDWVALCQLYGTMMDLPKGWPMWVRDLRQLAEAHGEPSRCRRRAGPRTAR
jgi:hypothetical protein